MANFDQFIQALWEREPDPRERGLEFERVCKWYLETDPVYAAQLEDVWLWKEWPDRWSDEDTGIDLVARDLEGNLWAMQAKCYDPANRLNKSDIDSFLSESARPEFSFKLLLSTAKELGRKALQTVDALQVRYLLYYQFMEAQVDWPERVDEAKVAPKEKKRALPYQKPIIAAVCEGFETSSRGQLIMACGTGKTLTALWIHERLKSARTLVLLPSLSLMKQTLATWAAERRRMFAFLAVCSDESVGEGDDDAIQRKAALAIPVTTDSESIAAFLKRDDELVVFCTYQSSPRLAEVFAADSAIEGFDLIIADEAHRCAGRVSSDYATALDEAQIPSKRRLFMTATPRVFTGRVQKQAKESDFEIASMDNEAIFGPQFHRLPFGEAIEDKLLSDYQVLVVGVTDSQVKDWTEERAFVTRDGTEVENARDLASHIALLKAMGDHDLSRVITFHNRVVRARQFSNVLPEVNAWLDPSRRLSGKLHAQHVSGKMSAGKRGTYLQELSNVSDGERRVLSNARCLSEGVDVPSIDGVAFIEPRRSQVDVVQAVGRAIRLSGDKKIGTIVLALFIGDGDDPIECIDQSDFKAIGQVLQALRDHDDTLAEELDESRRKLGRLPGSSASRPSRLVLDIPVELVGADFADSFTTQLVRAASVGWMEAFGALLDHVARTGSASVVREVVSDTGFRLGSWVFRQRQAYRASELSEQRIMLLEQISSWSWDPRWETFEATLELLKNYIVEHGHSRVPSVLKVGDVQLGLWVSNKRKQYRVGRLRRDYIDALNSLPEWQWEWDANQGAWDANMQALHGFAAREGHCRVKKGVVEAGLSLGNFVTKARRDYRAGALSQERINDLMQVPGWFWSVHDKLFRDGIAALSSFVDREGHCSPPKRHKEDGVALVAWIERSRSNYRKGTLPQDRIEALEALPGWSWSPGDASREKYVDALWAFAREHGHTQVKQSHVQDGVRLGTWVAGRRRYYKSGELDSAQVKLLEQLPGWSWNPRADQELARQSEFDQMVDALGMFREREGHALVPKKHCESGMRLGSWSASQRMAYAQGRLSPEEVAALEAIDGWVASQEVV